MTTGGAPMTVATDRRLYDEEEDREPLPSWLLGGAAAVGGVGIGFAATYGLAFGIGAAVVVALGLWLATRLETCMLILAGAVPALSGLRRGFPVPSLRAGEALLVAAGGLILVLGRRSQRARWSTFEWLFFGYVAATIGLGFYALRSQTSSENSDFSTLLVPVFHFALFLAVRVLAGRPGLRERAIRVMLLSTIPVSLAAILQYFDIAGVKARLSSISDLGQFGANVDSGYVARATGPFNHWHLLAGFLMPILLLGVAVAVERAWDVISPMALTVSMTLAGVALLLTLTYTVFTGFIAGALIIGVWARKAHVMAIALALVAVAAAILFSGQLEGRIHDQFTLGSGQGGNSLLPQTVQFRFTVWQQQFLPVIEENPTFGYGAVTPSKLRWSYTESVYITMLLRGGFILLMVFGAFWLAMLVRAWTRVHDPNPGIRLAARALAASALVLIPMQAVFPYFTAPGLPHVIAVLAGLAFAPDHETASREASRLTRVA
jgi:hypothetical protein